MSLRIVRNRQSLPMSRRTGACVTVYRATLRQTTGFAMLFLRHGLLSLQALAAAMRLASVAPALARVSRLAVEEATGMSSARLIRTARSSRFGCTLFLLVRTVILRSVCSGSPTLFRSARSGWRLPAGWRSLAEPRSALRSRQVRHAWLGFSALWPVHGNRPCRQSSRPTAYDGPPYQLIEHQYGQAAALIIGFLAPIPVTLGAMTIVLPVALYRRPLGAPYRIRLNSLPLWVGRCVGVGMVLFAP